MSKKALPRITAADVDRLIAEAGRVRDAMTDMCVLIGAGQCDRLPDPTGTARRCMGVSAVFSQATSHFLCRAELQDRTDD